MLSIKCREIISWLRDYKVKTNCKGVVLGISGGKDSTVVAMLAKKVWGENVIGVLMPNGIQIDIADSQAIVDKLGIQFCTVNINEAYTGLLNSIQDITITEKSKTNIPPRLRMATLYAIAQSVGYRVIGTGNRSEGYSGWCTKFGDSACDFNPIAHLTCTEVVELGKELAQEFGLDEKFIIKSPADGLTGKTDEENFGFTYAELDKYILTGEATPELKTIFDKLHKYSDHKRNMPLTLF